MILWLLIGVAWAHGPLDATQSAIDAEILERPKDPALYIRRAQLHLVQGEEDFAAEDFQAALERGGDVALDLAIVREDEATLDALLPAPHAGAHAARAELRWARGAWAPAMEDLDAAVRLDPSPERYMARMRVAEAQDPQRAIDGLEGAPGAVCALERVRLLRETGQTGLARAQVDALLEQNPEHPEWLLLRAELSVFGRPYRRRAEAILAERIQTRPSEANQALYAQSQQGCAQGGTNGGALWALGLLLLWRRRE